MSPTTFPCLREPTPLPPLRGSVPFPGATFRPAGAHALQAEDSLIVRGCDHIRAILHRTRRLRNADAAAYTPMPDEAARAGPRSPGARRSNRQGEDESAPRAGHHSPAARFLPRPAKSRGALPLPSSLPLRARTLRLQLGAGIAPAAQARPRVAD